MNKINTKTWSQYEAGKDYKRRIGLYDTVAKNERFYRGDQWSGGKGDLPKPVFNILKRVSDYLICSVASADLRIRYTGEELPFLKNSREADSVTEGLKTLTENAAYRWESCGMDAKALRLVTDAAVTGDGVLYCYWNPDIKSPSYFSGDIVTQVIDSVNVFPADVNRPDIQSQDYIIISGRASVASLKREAEEAGVSEADIKKIVSDSAETGETTVGGAVELEGEDEAKATFIIKFWREDGKVLFEKSVKSCVIKRARTECRLYPIAYFNWTPVKNRFHGDSPITHLIPNQQYINRAFAMAMKHMTDTAFSKVIYDKSKIPEWSNEVGEAIAAVGGNISDAVSVVGTGEMQSGYTDLIDSAVSLTKELMGATESALGNSEASNTSAILALQETSRIPLQQVRSAYYRCIEELANIWADMMCAYYPSERLLPCVGADGTELRQAELSSLKREFLGARVDVSEVTRYSAAGAQAMLDKLLEGGYISPESYISRLPAGVITDRGALIADIKNTKGEL